VQSLEKRGIEVVVVDDGSGEEYLPLFSQLEKNSRAKVIHFYVNQGKGAALKEGLSYLNKIDDDFTVITLDADGQHSLKDALYLLDKSMESEDSLILGVTTCGDGATCRVTLSDEEAGALRLLRLRIIEVDGTVTKLLIVQAGLLSSLACKLCYTTERLTLTFTLLDLL